MGITLNFARFLLHTRSSEGLGSTLTLGRQQLFLSPRDQHMLSREFGVSSRIVDGQAATYAESFLREWLGATAVTAMDASPYEGASVVHDLNRPVARDLEESFDTIIDGGTLEHVFDFPVALASCMRMLRVGGRLFMCSPANSLMGHGFYQFSPELLYRSLSRPHGFDVEAMHAIQSRYVSTDLEAVGKPLDVADPERLVTRTVVTSKHPLSLLVCARKVEHLETPFASPPQQSDYVMAWGSSGSNGPARSLRVEIVEKVWGKLPSRLKWKLWNEYGRRYRHTLRNRAWFKPLHVTDPAKR